MVENEEAKALYYVRSVNWVSGYNSISQCKNCERRKIEISVSN